MKAPSPSRLLAAGLTALALIAFSSASFGQAAPAPADKNAAQKNEKSDTSEVVTLNPFEVKATSNVGYRAESTSSSGRLAQDYIDIPQTVDVVTAEFMKDFNLNNSRDALSYVPSVFMASMINDGVTAIRGTTVNAIYFDGMASSGGAFGGFVLPTEFYDRVEVVKGPSSAAFGLGQPGGIINFITKKPQGLNRTELTTGIGDHNTYRGVLDTQGVANKLSYRLVIGAGIADDQVRDVHSQSVGFQLALKYQLTPKTTLQLISSHTTYVWPGGEPTAWFHTTLGAQANGYLPYPGQPDPAVPIPKLVDKTEWNLAPGWDQSRAKAFRTNLIIDHQISDRAGIRNSFVADNMHMDIRDTFPALFTGLLHPAPDEYRGAPLFLWWPYKGHSWRDTLDFVAKYEAGSVKMTTLVGGEIYAFKTDGNFQINFAFNPNFTFYDMNIYTGQPSSPGDVSKYIVTPWISTQNLLSDNRGYGYYVQQEASFFKDKLTLMAAWRLDYLDYKTKNRNSGELTAPGWQNTKGAPRAAITYKPKPWLSIYGLYTEHKDPTKVAPKWIWGGTQPPPVDQVPDVNANIFVQPRGYTEEAGVKALMFEDKVGVSVAAFRAINSGGTIPQAMGTHTNPDGTNTVWSINTIVDTRVTGVEATVAGQVGTRLILTGSYAVARGTAPAINAVNDKYTKQINPPATVSVHGKYDFGNQPGQGLYTTFGVICYGPFWFAQQKLNNGGPPTNFYWSSWQYTADVGLGYTWGGKHPKQLAFSANNVTNRLVSLGSFVSDNFAELPLRKLNLTYTVEF